MKIKNLLKLFALTFLTSLFFSCSDNDSSSTTETSQSRNYIKNISAASLYDPLEKKGFNIDKQIGSDAIFVNCDRSTSEFSEHVRISGDESSEINEIKASYTNYSTGKINNKAKPFLGFIATLPYENSNPEQAKKWVEENIDKNSQIEINGVIFEIIGNSKNIRTLLITPKS
jgi:ABC-type molybdate transport system substrate-binding protein